MLVRQIKAKKVHNYDFKVCLKKNLILKYLGNNRLCNFFHVITSCKSWAKYTRPITNAVFNNTICKVAAWLRAFFNYSANFGPI